MGPATHARRSTPAEPVVAYCGSGYSLPIRGSRIRTWSLCLLAGETVGLIAPSTGGMNGGSRLSCVLRSCGFSAMLVALSNHGDELARQCRLAGQGKLLFAAAPVHGQSVVVFVE